MNAPYQTLSQLSDSVVRYFLISFALGKADLWNASTSAWFCAMGSQYIICSSGGGGGGGGGRRLKL